MNQRVAVFFPLVFIAGVALVFMVIAVGTNLYGRYLGISRGKGGLVWLASLLGSLVVGFWRIHQFGRVGLEDVDVVSICCAFFLPWAAIPFLAKLYLTWIAGTATDAEKAPGMEGVRAWLRGGNLVCAVLISVCLWLGFGYSFWAPVALALMALLAFPVLNMALATDVPKAPAPSADTLAPERERVLKMLDDGKVTAQESAELLNALAHSAPARPPQSAPVPHRKMVWIGAALLLVGFFLPWFVVKTSNAQEVANLNQMMNQFSRTQGMLPPDFGGIMPQAMTFSYVGGDIAHGLGWWILVLGILAAVVPFVAANVDPQTCQKISLVALAAGAIILVYLLTEGIHYVSAGILLCLAGYALEFVGILTARRLDWSRAI